MGNTGVNAPDLAQADLRSYDRWVDRGWVRSVRRELDNIILRKWRGDPFNLLTQQFWRSDVDGCVNCRPEDAKWIFRWTRPTVEYDPGDLMIGMPGGTLVEVHGT